MSPELIFFAAREAKKKSLVNEGYMSLDVLESKFHVTSIDLLQEGYLEYQKSNSTSDIYNFCVSKKGKKLLFEIIELNLILVKPNYTKWLVR